MNLQQLPSSGGLGKLIKSCFAGGYGKIFCGADFNALEARIDALTTKDSNKLAIFLEGYDSHAFNAYHYWKDQFPEIRLIKPEDNLRTYKVVVGDTTHWLYEGTPIEMSDGSIINVEDLNDSFK